MENPQDSYSLAALALTEEKDREIVRVADELRKRLSLMIQTQDLEAVVVLGAMARLSATCIHMIQELFNRYGGNDFVIEEDFHDMLTAYLTSLDMDDVKAEIEKISKEQLN